MMVNPDVDGYRKTPNRRKKCKKNTENQKTTKTEIKGKWGPGFYT